MSECNEFLRYSPVFYPDSIAGSLANTDQISFLTMLTSVECKESYSMKHIVSDISLVYASIYV